MSVSLSCRTTPNISPYSSNHFPVAVSNDSSNLLEMASASVSLSSSSIAARIAAFASVLSTSRVFHPGSRCFKNDILCTSYSRVTLTVPARIISLPATMLFPVGLVNVMS
ncbi:hypothetical protein BC01_203 [Bacillus phage BC01]|nr:hypothetical protein BC01_203 [Bacillus phage BC01]